MRTSCTGTRNRLAPGTRASCGRRRAITAPTGERWESGFSAMNMNPELRAPNPPPVTAVTVSTDASARTICTICDIFSCIA